MARTLGDNEGVSLHQTIQAADDDSTGNVVVFVGDVSLEQQAQDEAVRRSLGDLVLSRLPRDRMLKVMLCEHPGQLGMSLEQLAAVETRSFEAAGYGHRAEGMHHFERVFRGYEVHGPLRYMIIAECDEGGDPHALTWGNYFQVYDGYDGLDHNMAEAMQAWRMGHPGLEPNQYVGSKFVTDPSRPPLAVGLSGPAGLLLKAVLLGLADAQDSGITMAARTQYASQRLIRGVLPMLVPGIDIFFDQELEGEGTGGMQAMILAYVPHSNDNER